MDAEVVEHEHRRGPHHLEQLVVAEFAVRLVSGAQVVQQVGHDHEEGGVAVGDAAPGGGRGEVRLAGAGRAGEDEPTLRLVGEGLRGPHRARKRLLVGRVGAAPARAQVLEREPRQGAEVAVALEAGQALLRPFVLRADAGEGAPEIGMAEAHGPAYEACAAAVRAGIGRRVRPRVVLFASLRCSGAPATLVEYLFQALHSRVPPAPSG